MFAKVFFICEVFEGLGVGAGRGKGNFFQKGTCGAALTRVAFSQIGSFTPDLLAHFSGSF